MKSSDIDIRLNFLKEIGNSPENLKSLGILISRYNNGEWAQSFVNCIYQYSRYDKPDLYDKFILFQTIQSLEGRAVNHYVAFQVDVGECPYPDKAIESNNKVLSKLKQPFEANFVGGTQDSDGVFSWSRPIHVPVLDGSDVKWLLVDAETVPLEVGYNSSTKFDLYMKSSGGIARWPYDSNYITIFINADLISTYTTNNNSFKELLDKSKETIEDCLIERNPWEKWKQDVSMV